MSAPFVFCRRCGSSNPLSAESTRFCCTEAKAAFQEEPVSTSRIRQPRINGQPVSWTEAISYVVKQIGETQQHDPNKMGFYLGTQTWYRGLDWMQTILTAIKLGTTSIFTDQCKDDASRLLITEWMLGHATPLLTDLSRAHNIIILGDNPAQVGWGALQPDHDYTAAIIHSQNTKQTKVSMVSSAREDSPFNVQSHIVIRPGTETFFLLGMLHLVVKNGWYDKQFVDKYTSGLNTLQQWLKPFTVAKCAQVCGISEAEISGLTLKWTRSAMGLIHLTPGALRTVNATAGAWAWLVLHTLTANALRPGGIYETAGTVDILPVLVGLRTHNAPNSQVGGQPLLWMQNMASQLLAELDAGNLDCLFLLDTPEYPRQTKLHQAIQRLKCSIVMAEMESPLTDVATVVLPRTTCWEESDIALHRNTTFSTQCLPTSAPIHPAFGDARSANEVLSEISRQVSFKWRGSELGMTNRLLANQLSKGNLSDWSQRAWGLLHEDDMVLGGSMNYKGEHNRALWRPSEDQIDLAPTDMQAVLQRIQWPTEDNDALWLHTSHHCKTTATLEIEVHPNAGFSDGQQVALQTEHGMLTGTVTLNDTLQSLTVRCSAQHKAVLNLLPSQTDPWSGTPTFNGVPCKLSPAQ